jgi:hypothetical protein
MSLFMGEFGRCTDDSSAIKMRSQCVGVFLSADGVELIPREWVLPKFNFDNIFRSLLSLFVLSNQEGWVPVMRSGIDATGPNMQPVPENEPLYGLFFVFFIIIGCMLLINLFVGIVYIEFRRSKIAQEMIDNATIELQQKRNQSVAIHIEDADGATQVFVEEKMLQIMHVAENLVRSRSSSDQLRLSLIRLCCSPKFDNFIVFCIFLNMLFMCLKHDLQSSTFNSVDDYSNICFTFIFCCEALIKILALRVLYFRDGWNWFDFFICLVSLLDVSISFIQVSFLRVLRVGRVIARVLRTLRLAMMVKKSKNESSNSAEDVGRMFLTILQSISAISSVGGLLLIMLFVFSILAVALFGDAPRSSQITSDNNFTTVFQAIRVNLRVRCSRTAESLILEQCDAICRF